MEDRVGLAGSVGRRLGQGGAQVDELGRLRRRPVPDDHVVTGVEEPTGDAAAHPAEPDDGDRRHAAVCSHASTSSAFLSGGKTG